MEKIINIGGKEVKMASTAGTLYRYRTQFKKDFLKDLAYLDSSFKELKKKKDNNEYAEFNILQLETFEQMAWAMAKTANSNVPPIEQWLDEFETFSIYKVLPELLELASFNFTNNDEKKNIVPKEVREN